MYSSFFFRFRFPTKRPSGTPLYISSGNVSIISPGDVVQISDEREYRVLRINPHSSTVVRRRVDASTNQRSFMRPSTSICTLPATTRDIAVEVNEPTENCLCEIPPPPVLPDVADISISCNLDFDEYNNSTHPEFDSVAKWQQGFEEAKLAANAAFKELCTEVLKVTELKEKINSLQQRITTLTEENEGLLKRTMDLTEDVSALSAIATNKRYVPVMQRIIWHHVLQQPLLHLPLTIGFNYAPPNFLFNLLGCPQSSTPELISENVKCLLQILHPDKNPQAPPTVTQYIPLISFAKTILLDKSFSPVYRCCGLDGIVRRQHKLCTCRRCDPFLQTLNDLMDL